MPSPLALLPTPPEFHPEFGYIWPAAHNRRLMRIALTSTAAGALFGIIVALVMTSRADPDVARTATALSVAPAPAQEPAIVGPASAPIHAAATNPPSLPNHATSKPGPISTANASTTRRANPSRRAFSSRRRQRSRRPRQLFSRRKPKSPPRRKPRRNRRRRNARRRPSAVEIAIASSRPRTAAAVMGIPATPMRRLIRRVTKRGGLLGAGDIAAS